MEYEEEHEEGEEELAGIPTSYDHHHRLPNNSTSPMSMPAPPPPPSLARTSSINAGRKPAAGVRYRECLKNHAVSIGGHAVDGCGEFMAAGEEGSLDGLKCAACGCHRNFHRKEADGDPASQSAALAAAAAAAYHGPFSPYYRTPAGYLHVAPHHRPPPTLALPSTSGGGPAHSRDDQEDMSNPSSGGGAAPTPTGSSKKRFRTKFTVEQKERMLALAERLGWRIQKQDEAMVQQFCAEMGLKRHVLKVWMHNNKHTLGKKP